MINIHSLNNKKSNVLFHFGLLFIKTLWLTIYQKQKHDKNKKIMVGNAIFDKYDLRHEF